MTQPTEENLNENQPVDETAVDSSLSLEDALKELRKVRAESAARRVENRDLKERADKWKAYEDSQKTEMQKLQEALEQRDKELSTYKLDRMKVAIAKEVGLDAEDAELLSGSDEQALRAHAERLKARLSPKQEKQSPADLLAGTRGRPIGGSDTTPSIDDMIRASARRGRL